MKFKQKKWLKPYIDLNTEQRVKAKIKFQVNISKGLNSFLSGNFVEDLRKGMVTARTAEECFKDNLR